MVAIASGERPAAAQDSAAAIDWAVAFRSDLRWAYETIRDNHPGTVDTDYPAFRQALEHGYALALNADVRTEAGYIYALKRFVVGLGDTHTTLAVDFSRVAARWAGVVVQDRGGRAIVIDREADATPALGAEVVACDGEPFAARVDRELSFQGHPLAHARRRQALTWALVDGSNPFAPPAASCDVLKDGVSSTWQVSWRAFDSTTFRRLTAAVSMPTAVEGIVEPAAGVYWIGLPTFHAQSTTLRSLVDEIVSRATAFRYSRAVIFDVRGNGGGSTMWGDEIVTALFGAPATEAGSPRGSAVDWRASVANANFIRSVIPDLAAAGTNEATLDLLRTIEAGLRQSLAAGLTYWRQPGDTGRSGGVTRQRPAGRGAFPARFVLLTDDRCASACLGFADRLLAQPGVTHVGMVTGADNLYIDKRAPMLSPSGKARLDHSLKVYRGRRRGDMESYQPDLPYSGEWTTAALQSWVLNLLDRGELTGARPHNTGQVMPK